MNCLSDKWANDIENLKACWAAIRRQVSFFSSYFDVSHLVILDDIY